MGELIPEAFDNWRCINCNNRFERNIKFKSMPKCPKCKSAKLGYIGQVAR